MLKRRARKPASANLAFEHVALQSKGTTLTLAVPAGSTVAVVGPGSAGKSKLLAVLSGFERPARGEVFRPDGVSAIGHEPPVRREKPSTLARRGAGDRNPTRIAEVLSALSLWEERNKSLGSLGASKQVAAQFIEPLTGATNLLVADCELDLLDPWTRDGLWQLIRARRSEGLTFVYATNLPELAALADLVIVLKDQQVVFSDSPQALIRSVSSGSIVVATDDQAGARAIASPFEVEISEVPEGLKFETAEAQQLTAKLLLEGYGDVRYVIQRTLTFAEALKRLIG